MNSDKLVLPIGRTLHIPGPATTARDLADMAHNAGQGRASKPTGYVYLIRPDGETVMLRADGTHELAEIQEMAQSIVEQ